MGDTNSVSLQDTQRGLARNIAKVGIVTGSVLLGPGTLALVLAFTYTSYKKMTGVYCKELEWYPDPVVDENKCLLNVAVDKFCPKDEITHFYPSTVSEMIEFWPYAASLVLGVGASNMFLAVLMINYTIGAVFPIVIAYISYICFWGVIGTSAFGDNDALKYSHYGVSFLLVLTSVVYAVVQLYNANIFYGRVEYTLLGAMVVSGIGMVVGVMGIMLVEESQLSSAFVSLKATLSISELVFINFFSFLMYRLVSTARSRGFMKPEKIPVTPCVPGAVMPQRGELALERFFGNT